MPEKPLRERALAYLARREHSRAELARKLAPYCEERDEIDALLDDFTRHGWLSEERYADMLVSARQGKYGSRRIAHELREKGVSDEAIGVALAAVQDSDLENARVVWAKKFGRPPVDAQEKAKQMRFLASRGFGQEVVWKILNSKG